MWVPLYHDLGLIGNILFSLYVGSHCVVMAPETFLRSPLNWLNAISKYKADISFAPTFAYDYSLRYAKELSPDIVDLRHWRVAVVGAEPIYQGTLERFSKSFAHLGFSINNFHCAYGLAESTLMVVTTPYRQGPKFKRLDAAHLEQGIAQETISDNPREYRTVVSSGVAGADHSVVIVDPHTAQRCPDGQVGEIWLSGPCITKGYFQNETATADMFSVQIEGFAGKSFLRTGDTGFIDQGELYPTGRIKDLIIINGANHYPQDIEQTAFLADPTLRIGCAAAFSIVSEDAERLVVTVEVRKEVAETLNAQQVITNVMTKVRDIHGLVPHDLLLIPAGTLSKTSSGKIQRQLTKKRYLNGEIPVIAQFREEPPAVQESPELVDLRNWIQFILAEAIGKPIGAIRLENHVTQVGIDSVKVVAILDKVAARIGVDIKELKPWEFDSIDGWIVSLAHMELEKGR